MVVESVVDLGLVLVVVSGEYRLVLAFLLG